MKTKLQHYILWYFKKQEIKLSLLLYHRWHLLELEEQKKVDYYHHLDWLWYPLCRGLTLSRLVPWVNLGLIIESS
jgi:hypothetical protein